MQLHLFSHKIPGRKYGSADITGSLHPGHFSTHTSFSTGLDWLSSTSHSMRRHLALVKEKHPRKLLPQDPSMYVVPGPQDAGDDGPWARKSPEHVPLKEAQNKTKLF